MNAQFSKALNGGDGALCELQPGELADVNGGINWGAVVKGVVEVVEGIIDIAKGLKSN